MLEGKYRYAIDLSSPSETSALLRRNTHRLEKGLLMRPRRELFALDYIEETVAYFEKVARATAADGDRVSENLQWSQDVLTEYFAVTTPDARTDSARRRFQAVTLPCNGDGSGKFIPYHRDLDEDRSTNIDQLMSLARRRRSVRWFLDKPVPREVVDRAVAVAAQSPSACNRQPFHFRVFDDPDLVREVARVPMGTAGYADNIPVIAVVVGQLRNYPNERDRHLIYVDGSLAAMSFVYALEAQGVGSCCINWPDMESQERKMASLLALDPDERPVMCIALGYPDPDGLVAYSQKKPVEQLRRYN